MLRSNRATGWDDDDEKLKSKHVAGEFINVNKEDKLEGNGKGEGILMDSRRVNITPARCLLKKLIRRNRNMFTAVHLISGSLYHSNEMKKCPTHFKFL